MVAFKIDDFAGMVPRRSDRLLPDTFATLAVNTRLLRGELNGFNVPLQEETLSPGYTALSVFRIPTTPTDTWLPFNSQQVFLLPGPLANDAYDRFYWTGDGTPKMSTLSEIGSGTTPRELGLDGPSTAPTVTHDGTGTGAAESRAYVVTFITDIGEESQPSDPASDDGKEDGNWDLTGIPTSADSRVTKRRIYRTVTGSGSVDYRFVADINDNTTTTYSDSDPDVSDNAALESTSWAPPPSDLNGLRLMPNGFFVGFSGRDLYFSEPYRPHAWPAEYVLSTDEDIIGLGVVGSTCAVITTTSIFVATGTTPAIMAFRKLDLEEPCVAVNSIVEMDIGVFYASRNGIVAVTPQGAGVISEEIITRQDWNDDYAPDNIMAVRYRADQYLAMYANKSGFIFDARGDRRTFTEIEMPWDVDGMNRDRYTGNIYMLASNTVYTFDPYQNPTGTYIWKSKVFDAPQPINLGAAHLKYEREEARAATELSNLYNTYNTERFAAGQLQALGMAGPVGGVRTYSLTAEVNDLQDKAPVGGSPLRTTGFISDPNFAINFTVYADGDKVFSATFDESSDPITRLPSGFLATTWQFELEGNMKFFSLSVAETRMELMTV